MVSLVNSRLFRALNNFRNVLRHISIDLASSNNQNEEEKKNETNHIYKKKLNKHEIINFLAENIQYNKGDFIVTNKLYGIGKTKPTKVISNYVPQTVNEYYLKDILPELSKKLEVDSLKIVQTPERFASGALILAKNEEAKEVITTRILNLKKSGLYYETYLVIVVGNLRSHLNTKFALKLVQKDNKVPHYIVVNKWPRKFVNRENLRVYNWSHKVLSSSEFASLVEIKLSSSRLNSLKLFLSTKCFTPVLGDQIFGSRVISVNNVKIAVDPVPQIKPPRYDSKLLSALELDKEDSSIIPSHVHLLSNIMPLSKKKHLHVKVPPPESFVWTCRQLGLNLDTVLLDENSNSHLPLENKLP